jgi:preprotein translocase subunit SecG
MLYGIVIGIHVVVSLVLIFVILLQAGRGGGISETFGASATQSIFGSKTSLFLRRATEVSAVVFILTCLLLGVMTSHRGRSLVAHEGIKIPMTQGQKSGAPAQPASDQPPVDY